MAVTIDDASGLVRYVRTREPYPSVEALRDFHQKMRDTLPSLAPRALVLLLDIREAPARNDDPFEAEIQQLLRAIMPRFSAHAVLVKSAIGRLQAQRLAKSRGGEGEVSVFVDEAEALAHLKAAKGR